MAKTKGKSKPAAPKKGTDMGPGMMDPKNMPMHDKTMTKLMRDHKKKHHSGPDKMGDC